MITAKAVFAFMAKKLAVLTRLFEDMLHSTETAAWAPQTDGIDCSRPDNEAPRPRRGQRLAASRTGVITQLPTIFLFWFRIGGSKKPQFALINSDKDEIRADVFRTM